MKDSELQIDRSCHVLYSKPCKKEILAKITLHYPEVERQAVWEQVQLRYAELLSKWRTDLGGKKNFHNGVGGTYDCIAMRFGFADIMPALCNVDYASMELLHAKLVRTTTCVDGCRCDYTICGDKDPYVKEHPEYRDENGYRRNK